MSYYQPYGLMELSTFYSEEGNDLLTSKHQMDHCKNASNFNERNNLIAETRNPILPINRNDRIPQNSKHMIEEKFTNSEKITNESSPSEEVTRTLSNHLLEGKTKKGVHILDSEQRKKIAKKKTDKAIKIAKKTKDTILDNIFNFDYLTKLYGIKTTSKIIFVLFWILIFSHLSFGYTISTKRLLLLFCFIFSFLVIYIIHNFIFVKIANSEYSNEKLDSLMKKYYPILVLIIFILITVFSFRKLEHTEFISKFKFTIPKD